MQKNSKKINNDGRRSFLNKEYSKLFFFLRSFVKGKFDDFTRKKNHNSFFFSLRQIT